MVVALPGGRRHPSLYWRTDW